MSRFEAVLMKKNMSTRNCFYQLEEVCEQLEEVCEQLEIFSTNWKYFFRCYRVVLVKNMLTETCYNQLEAVSEQLENFSTNCKYFSKSFKAVLMKTCQLNHDTTNWKQYRRNW